MSRKTKKSQGFTIVQLLIVVSIIGLVIGMLIPAVRNVREAADRAKCQDRMCQYTLAIHNYASTYQDNLPGVLHVSVNAASVTPFNYSLLPFIEQDALYKVSQASPATPWFSFLPNGTTVMQVPIGSFHCPEDRSLNNGMCNSNPFAGSSYAPNGRVFGTVTRLENVNVPVLMPAFKITNIPDGTNNTIFLEERVAGYKDSEATPNWCNSWAYPVQTGGKIDPMTTATARSFGSILHPADGSDKAMGPVRTLFDDDAESADTKPPVANLPLFSFNPSQADARRPGSYHQGLIYVGMGNGSVRAISSSISPETWSAAIHPNDGVPLGTDW